MTDDRWTPGPDPSRDRHSAWGDAPAPPPPRPWQTGAALPHVSPPSSYLLFGILTTIFCFLPFGIVSIVKGSSVATLWAQGRYEEAHRASRASRNWAIAAVVAVPVMAVLFMAFALSLFAVAFH